MPLLKTAARRHIHLVSLVCVACLFSGSFVRSQDFKFDTTISRPLLENYLSRSISYTELLHDDLNQPRNEHGVDPKETFRFIVDTKAKFVGRALMLWGREKNFSNFVARAKPFAAKLHQADPGIVLQAAAFEIVTPEVDS